MCDMHCQLSTIPYHPHLKIWSSVTWEFLLSHLKNSQGCRNQLAVLLFSTSDWINQMCYCCRKLDFMTKLGRPRQWEAEFGLSRPLTASDSLSQPIKWLETGSESAWEAVRGRERPNSASHHLSLTRERPWEAEFGLSLPQPHTICHVICLSQSEESTASHARPLMHGLTRPLTHGLTRPHTASHARPHTASHALPHTASHAWPRTASYALSLPRPHTICHVICLSQSGEHSLTQPHTASHAHGLTRPLT